VWTWRWTNSGLDMGGDLLYPSLKYLQVHLNPRRRAGARRKIALKNLIDLKYLYKSPLETPGIRAKRICG
jgi:hypothetical protein